MTETSPPRRGVTKGAARDMGDNYGITFAEDNAMPEGFDFALVLMADGVRAFYRESALSPDLLEDSWSAVRALREDDAMRADPYLRAVV